MCHRISLVLSLHTLKSWLGSGRCLSAQVSLFSVPSIFVMYCNVEFVACSSTRLNLPQVLFNEIYFSVLQGLNWGKSLDLPCSDTLGNNQQTPASNSFALGLLDVKWFWLRNLSLYQLGLWHCAPLKPWLAWAHCIFKYQNVLINTYSSMYLVILLWQ